MSVTDEPFYLGAYWGPRTEGVESCAERLVRCMEDLGNSSGAMSTWFRKGTSRKSAKAPVTWHLPVVVDLLLAGRNRKEFGDEVIEELGYRVGLWNGSRSTPVSMSVTCGANPRTPGIMNAFVLQLPELALGASERVGLYAGDTLRDALRGVVECWQPDWAVVTKNSLRIVQGPAPRAPHVGWLTYLSGHRSIPRALPEGVSVDRLRDGVMIALAEDPRDVTEEFVVAVRDALAQSGSLEPTSAA